MPMTTPSVPAPPPFNAQNSSGWFVVAGVNLLAVGGDEIERAYTVGGEAVVAGKPAEVAAERVADGADMGGRAEQRRQAVLLRGSRKTAARRAPAARSAPAGAQGRS